MLFDARNARQRSASFWRVFRITSFRPRRCIFSVACRIPNQPLLHLAHQGAHAPAVDWWSFGCVVYEMLSGTMPFGDSADLTKYEIYTNITEKKLRFGKGFTSRSKNLLLRLLDKNPGTRLGWEGVEVIAVQYSRSAVPGPFP